MVTQPGRKKIIKAIVTVATTLLTIVATAACGNTTSTTASSKAKTVDVAVSVNQWESVAKIIGGKDISLHVILSNDTVNARDFEPTASNVATLENAQLVLVNGAGYDRWATNAAQQGKAIIVNAASTDNIHAGDNPHVWFSSAVRQTTAKAYLKALEQIDPSDTSTFEANYKTWLAGEDKLQTEIASAKKELQGKPYAATAPVSHYIMKDLGMDVKTPTGFAQAELNNSTPAPADIEAFRTLINEKKIDLLVDNVQEANSTTNQLVALARSKGIPIVDFTETMPSQYSDLDAWETALINNIKTAAKQSTQKN